MLGRALAREWMSATEILIMHGSSSFHRACNTSVGTSTYFLYLSKSTSNRRKSYSSRSKSTQKKMYLKYKYKVNKCT